MNKKNFNPEGQNELEGLNLEAIESNDQQPATKLSRVKKTADGPAIKADVAWLTETDPTGFFTEQETSSKYDAEREVSIATGLKVIAADFADVLEINPLILLLAKWWEVKSARAIIKKMIDEEATAKGFAPDVYLQVVLGEQIDKLANFQTAIDRIKYAKTYFKPRAGLSTKVPMKLLSIRGTNYNVPIAELEKAKIEFANDREAMKDYIISVSTPAVMPEEL